MSINERIEQLETLEHYYWERAANATDPEDRIMYVRLWEDTAKELEGLD
jgi:hypothetical protein